MHMIVHVLYTHLHVHVHVHVYKHIHVHTCTCTLSSPTYPLILLNVCWLVLSLSLALGGTHLWLLGVLVTACSVVPAEGRGGERDGGREGEGGREGGR